LKVERPRESLSGNDQLGIVEVPGTVPSQVIGESKWAMLLIERENNAVGDAISEK
jgi:hypothetical protein